MNAETGYQGWANYPTWCVNLWIGNERDLYARAVAIAAEEIADAPNHLNVSAGIWNIEETRLFCTADHLQEWVCEELAPDLGATFAADLLNHALGEVDWHEIASAWLETAVDQPLAVSEGEEAPESAR